MIREIDTCLRVSTPDGDTAHARAYLRSRAQLVTHYRRPGGTPDAAVDLHNLDGSLATTFDFSSLGIVRVDSVSYIAATDELVFTVLDATRSERFLVTDAAGKPRRSYRADVLPGLAELAPMATGPFAGEVAALVQQPSEIVRLFLP